MKQKEKEVVVREMKHSEELGCAIPSHWDVKALGEIVVYEQPQKYLVKNTNYNNIYSIPVLTAGKTFILGYTNEIEGIYNKGKVIIFDDFTASFHYVNFPFKIKSSAIKLLRTKCNNLKYIYESMRVIKFIKGSEHKRRWIAEFSKIPIPLPPVEEQEAIARVLGSADAVLDALAEQHAKAEALKTMLMQQLLSGTRSALDGAPMPMKHSEELGCAIAAHWDVKALGEVAECYGGTSLEKYVSFEGNYKFISIGNYTTNGKYKDDGKRIILNDLTICKLLYKNDLVMCLNDKTKKGNIIGNTILIDKDNTYIYNQRSQRIVINKDISVIYMWFMLNSPLIKKLFLYNMQGGTQYYINFSMVKKFPIPLPPVEEQEAIARVLGSADAVIDALAEQRATAEALKTMLMQQLLSGTRSALP